MVTSKTPGDGQDILAASANNLYDGVTMADLEGFDEQHQLNSRLAKRDGQLVEEVYSVGGLYDAQIARDRRASANAACRSRREPLAKALERAGSRSTRPATTAIARRSTSPGCRIAIRPWTR